MIKKIVCLLQNLFSTILFKIKPPDGYKASIFVFNFTIFNNQK